MSPSLYRSVSLKRAANELSTHKLDLMDLQEVKWDGSGVIPADDCTFF